MDNVFICINIQCAVYVYGASAVGCPECGLEGKQMTVKNADRFTQIYRETQDGQIENVPDGNVVQDERSKKPYYSDGIKWGEDLIRDCAEMQRLENWGIFPQGYHNNNCSLH